MKTFQNSDELIDLGAISVETRGIEPVGFEDQDPSDKYLFSGGISADD
ncbi:benenodin family lasso peptide [Sphingopyxis sp.]|nr:benenodin family lasso peptide [Sphingopyxis sp.]HET6523514.1 benenodin family lasso peptide [Sphingopyxis sp.]